MHSTPANENISGITAASIPDTLTLLDVNPQTGLSRADVEVRLKKYGYNEVIEQKFHPVLKFIGKFRGMSAWMLEAIILLSAITGKYFDLLIVSALLVVNAILGFIHERHASDVVATLRRRLQINARVLRNSTWQIIPARELVPGDIIRMRTGDILPADIKLLSGQMSLDQSALTGESINAGKLPSDLLPSCSVIRHGEGNGVVILTGAKTIFGRTIQLVQEARPKLHMEEVVAKTVRRLLVIVGLISALVFILSIIRHAPPGEMIPLLLVLLMSAVPVALPVMFTVSIALGAKELSRRGILVTRLGATEDAASMDVLCVDKTGTITMNQLKVTGVTPLGNATESEVLFAAALASQESNQDPIDLAILAAAKERSVFDNATSFKLVSFIPFNAKNRRTEALIDQNGKRVRVMKGAVHTVAQICGLQDHEIATLDENNQVSSQKVYRTIAVGRSLEPGPPVLIGLVTLVDPPRPEAGELITTLRNLGVSVKMLTGDALPVAKETARKVGLGNIQTISMLKANTLIGDETLDFLKKSDGLAEMYSEDKYVVVQLLQAAGHITGMTGDGVNDAPALRQAEVGIAVSTATDVAKAAASAVLTVPGLTNIVVLIEQGRMVHQRILTWVMNKLSRTILKAGFVSIAFVITGKFVVSAFSMLLLVFMTDFAKIALAGDRVLPSRKPQKWDIGGFVMVSVMLGITMTAESLFLLWITWSYFDLAANENTLYTFSFLTLLYMAVFSIISVRERRRFWKSLPVKTLVFALTADLLAGTAISFAGLPGLAPLTWSQVIVIFIYAMVSCLVINDALKAAMIKWKVTDAAL